MFVRKKKNKSGSVSIQIISKARGKYELIKTVGCAQTMREEELLAQLANIELQRLKGLQSLFVEPEDLVIENFVNGIVNNDLRVIGPEIIFGNIYEKMGFPLDGCPNYFKSLVLSRLVYPGSKLKTVDYFRRHMHIDVSVYSIYRYLDELSNSIQPQVEQICFGHTKKVLRGKIGVVFYDISSLYFEASTEDDFRIIGYNKDGKHQHPQLLIGLLVSSHGYPIGYQLFEGNTSETKTLIPVLKAFQKRFSIDKPIIVADSAMLSQSNIDALDQQGYKYILGGRLKNESQESQKKILSFNVQQDKPRELKTKNGRLIVSYSKKRANKDRLNREKGLKRLEKRVQSGRLTKSHINNRGYNKYLKLSGTMNVRIDYNKFNGDAKWDGLKGYITNTRLSKHKVISNYSHLWQIEKAFRISKTDLRIRPIYHRLKNRIEAHICICFVAYAIYKELERLLVNNKIEVSASKVIESIKEIRQLQYTLPKSRKVKTKILQPDQLQIQLLNLKI